MPQLGKIDITIIDDNGNAVVGATVALRRQGATVNGDQSGSSPLVVTVFDLGGIVSGDTVYVNNGTSAVTVSALSIPNQTVTLSGFVGSLSLTDRDRLSPAGSLPAVYTDVAGTFTGVNPLTTDAEGQALSNAADVGWAIYGPYDYLASGGTVDGVASGINELVTDYVVAALSPESGATSRDAIKIDNVTDDGVSLNNAITDFARTLAGASGGTKELPKGTILTSVQIVNKTKTVIRGQGRGATIIKAAPGFTFNGSTDSLTRLGDGTGAVHGCRFEHLTLDCDNIANSFGGYTTEANELSGYVDCAIQNAVLYGVFASGSGAANFILKDLEIFMSASGSAATTKGIYLLNTTGVAKISDLTINNISGAGTTMLAAIHAAHTSGHLVSIRGLHVENCTNGVKCSQSDIIISGETGHSTVTNCVLIDAGVGNIDARGIFLAGATNSINDQQLGNTVAGDSLYYRAGPIASANVTGSNVNVTWRIPNAVNIAGAFTNSGGQTLSGGGSLAGTYTGNPTFSGNPILSGVPVISGTEDISGRIRQQAFENIAIATTISVTKNNVRITGNGPVTLSTINVDGGAPSSAHDGMTVTIMLSLASTGTMTIDQGGNILIEAAASIGLTAGQIASFRWINAESKWMQLAPKAAH